MIDSQIATMEKESSQMEDRETLLTIDDLYVEYTTNDEAVKAVNGVSFSLKRGETLGLVGETGAGKTTIAKAILRILPNPPAKVASGTIVFDNTDLRDLSEVQMRKIRGREISMIFQDPMTALNPVMSVGKQIAEAVQVHRKCSWNEAEKEAKKALELVGIPEDRYHEYPHQFSGGMKQRVVIAIALSCNPDLLIADEPTTALDVTIQAQVLNLIYELQKKNKMAMILITHDLGIVAETCDKVAVVYAGEIVEYGTLRQVFKKPLHPYTIGLFGAIPSLTGDVGRLHNIEGMPCDPTHLPNGCKFAPRCKFAKEICKQNADVPLKDVGDGHLCRCYYPESSKGEN